MLCFSCDAAMEPRNECSGLHSLLEPDELPAVGVSRRDSRLCCCCCCFASHAKTWPVLLETNSTFA